MSKLTQQTKPNMTDSLPPPWSAAQARRVFDFWGEAARPYKIGYGWHIQDIVPFVESANLRPGESVLDLGTGIGWVALEAKKRVQHGAVVGVDISPKSLETARKECRTALGSESGNGRGSITFIEADISDIAKLCASLGTPSPRFDVITCCLTLHSMPGGISGQASLLKDWATLLVPGGRMIIDWSQNPDFQVAYVHCYPWGFPIVGVANPHPFAGRLIDRSPWAVCELKFRDTIVLAELQVETMKQIHYHAEEDWSSEVTAGASAQWALALRFGRARAKDVEEWTSAGGTRVPEAFVEQSRRRFARDRIEEYKSRLYMACHSNVSVRAVIRRR